MVEREPSARMTLLQASQRCGISPEGLRLAVHRGRLHVTTEGVGNRSTHYVTPADLDAYLVTRQQGQRGEGNGHAKLTAEDVQEIRRLHRHGQSIYQIAEQMGLSKSGVYSVVSGRTWGHLPE